MSEVQYKHIASVQHAVRVFETGLKDGREKKFHTQLEKDIRNLIEARDILLLMYRNPTLPFTDSEPSLAVSILDQIEDVPDESS